LLCLVAILFPFLSALAILEGIQQQSRISVEEGADLYVTMDMYGRNGMIPAGMAGEIEKIEGVEEAFPRVVSRITIERKLAVLLGLPMDEMPSSLTFVRGSRPQPDEVVVGRGVAKNLGLKIGDNLSIGVRIYAVIDHVPYLQKKVYRISGIFDSASSIWTSDLVLLNLEDAIATYEMEDFVTDIVVYVKPGRTGFVAEEIRKMNAYVRIQTKEMAGRYVAEGFNTRGGVFTILYTVAFALSIPAILVLSGFGLSARTREIGIFKALGWQSREVLEMVFFENILLALIGAPSAFLLSFIWIKMFNAPFIARVFIAEIGSFAPFDVPVRFLPLPFLLAFVLALVLTLAGSIYPTWKAATVPPVEAMR